MIYGQLIDRLKLLAPIMNGTFFCENVVATLSVCVHRALRACLANAPDVVRAGLEVLGHAGDAFLWIPAVDAAKTAAEYPQL